MMARTAKITGKHVLLALLAFFGVIIVANAIFITLAVRSFPGESEEKPYIQGLNYNKVLADRAEQAALGWRAEVVRAERTGDGAIIGLRLYDAADQPLLRLRIEGVLKRPAYKGEDTAITFNLTSEGVYQASVSPLSPGVWDLSAEAANEKGERFDVAARMMIE